MDSKQLRDLFPGASDDVVRLNAETSGMTMGTAKVAKAPKYLNHKTEYQGRIYDSAWEAQHAKELDLLVKAGEIIGWEAQFPVYLPGGLRMVWDFLVLNTDGTVELHETKSKVTKLPVYRRNLKQFKALYPAIKVVEIVKPDWRESNRK